MSNKDIAVSFLHSAATGNLDEAYELVSPSFRHHNPHFKGDAGSLKAGMADAHKQFPNTKIDVQRAIAAGDLVAVHSRVQHAPDKPAIAVVHIFDLKAIVLPSCGMSEWKCQTIRRTRMGRSK